MHWRMAMETPSGDVPIPSEGEFTTNSNHRARDSYNDWLAAVKWLISITRKRGTVTGLVLIDGLEYKVSWR